MKSTHLIKINREVRSQLKKAASNKKPAQFSTSDEPYPLFYWGIKLAEVRKISKVIYKENAAKLSKKQVFALASDLLKDDICEQKIIAFDWVFRRKKEFAANDFNLFQRWVKNHLADWNDVDDFACHALGDLIYQFPELLPKVLQWTSHKKWPVRRAAAVTLIPAIRNKRYIREMFVTCNHLLTDEHDLVRKGYGWLLKEGSRHFPRSVHNYVLTHKQEMPRVSLRYAIEKLPAKMKKEAMKKD